MNIFDTYLDKIIKIIINENKSGFLILPDKLDSINVDIPPKQFDCDISTNVSMVLAKINEKQPIELAKNISELIKKLKVKLTLFELLTLVYLISASKLKNTSFALVEAGLLYAGDSTRLWEHPKCQIITNINKQHLDWVKPKSLREICRQKVGYLSKKTTIYVGKQNPKTLKIIKHILKKNPSKQIYYGNGWTLKKVSNVKRIYEDYRGKIILQNPNIVSDALWENIALAIRVARDLEVSKKNILKGLKKCFFEGRMHFIKKGKLRKLLHPADDLCIDGCHSESSIKNHVLAIKHISKPKFAIWSLGKQRSPELFVKHLKIFKKIIAISIPGDATGSCSPHLLKKLALKNSIDCTTASNVQEAIGKISSKEPKFVSIIGSLYTAGKVLTLN
mgnify:CR=1 FL=1